MKAISLWQPWATAIRRKGRGGEVAGNRGSPHSQAAQFGERNGMTWIRKLFGLDFPEPAVGQVWRSRYSGRAIRVDGVRRSDCGAMWFCDIATEERDGWSIPMFACMYPSQWRRMLRREGRALEPRRIPPRPVGGLTTHHAAHHAGTAPNPLEQ